MEQSVKARKREELAKARRNQVLDAARVCVIAEGVHGATINSICVEAGMGVGHVYKVFASKDAIMIGLAERDFDEFMLHITPSNVEARLDVDAFIERFLSDLPWLLDRDRATLAQEVMVEAARNPKIADVITKIDGRFRHAIRDIMTPDFSAVDGTEIDSRIDTLLMLTRALAVHAALHSANDPATLAGGIELVLRALLSPNQVSKRNTIRTDMVRGNADISKYSERLGCVDKLAGRQAD